MLVGILNHSYEEIVLATTKYNMIAKINKSHTSIFITEEVR